MSSLARLGSSTSRRFRSLLQRWRRRMSGAVVVLMYHRVASVSCDPWRLCVSPDNFAQQLEVLKRKVHVISVTELSKSLEKGRLPRRGAVVTFDDGYADNLLEAKPLLEQYGV